MFSVDYFLNMDRYKQHILKTRHKYDDILEVIANYIADSYAKEKQDRIIISGKLAYDLFKKKSFDYIKPKFELRTYDIGKHAKILTDLLDKWCLQNQKQNADEPIWTVVLRTIIYKKQIEIIVNEYSFIKFIHLENIDKIAGFEMIKPITGVLFGYDVWLINPIFHLTQLYHEIYLPEYWADREKLEKQIYNIKKIIGSSEIISNSLEQIFTFLSESNHTVLVGSFALGKKTSSITWLSSDVEYDISYFVNLWSDQDVDIISDMVQMLDDDRLKRTAIKLNGRAIIYIFNSPEYELVPYSCVDVFNRKIRIGNPHVIIRFFLVDLWIIKKIELKGKLSNQFVVNKTRKIENYIKEVSTMEFEPIEYIGQYVNEVIDYKRKKLKSQSLDIYVPRYKFTLKKNN